MISRNLMTIYPELVHRVRNGDLVTPRGHECLEAKFPQTWILTHPTEWALCIPGRRLNPFFALAEVVWMWAGMGGADFISFYNKSITQFLDEGVPYFNAAYGKRVRHWGYREEPFRQLPYLISSGHAPESVEIDQLKHVIRKLQGDPFTRQAAVCLWDVVKDNYTVSKDYPCNNMIYFSQRDGKLNMQVVIRSNDLVWGTPYNMCQFVHLQALMAGSLELKIGTFTVMCANLHFYKNLYPDALESVVGWAESVATRQVDLDFVSRTMFGKVPDMEWDLDSFDQFIIKGWNPFEKLLRNWLERIVEEDFSPSTIGAFYMNKLLMLEDHLARFNVPEYWQSVFKVMFMYHCRKSKHAQSVYHDLLETLPDPFAWMIKEFDAQKG